MHCFLHLHSVKLTKLYILLFCEVCTHSIVGFTFPPWFMLIDSLTLSTITRLLITKPFSTLLVHTARVKLNARFVRPRSVLKVIVFWLLPKSTSFGMILPYVLWQHVDPELVSHSSLSRKHISILLMLHWSILLFDLYLIHCIDPMRLYWRWINN